MRTSSDAANRDLGALPISWVAGRYGSLIGRDSFGGSYVIAESLPRRRVLRRQSYVLRFASVTMGEIALVVTGLGNAKRRAAHLRMAVYGEVA